MSLLLKNLHIVDPNSPAHGRQANILIKNGKICSLTGQSGDKEIDLRGNYVSPGWFDLCADFNDPGNEYREDLLSGSEVAQSGGFTDVCVIPSTVPPIESKADVSYIKKKSGGLVDVHVIAAISEGLEGKNLTEMLDLIHAGAEAFSDGDLSIWNSELLLKALQYAADVGVPIIQNARDLNLSANTQMHEGRMSTYLGLRGEPSLSEELMVQRDLEILRYSGGSIHFSRISSAESVNLIKKAKRSGLHVTCDVGIHHLIFTHDAVGEFDTIYKALPPYRTEKDRRALIKGVKEGVIDAICSNHRPYDQESKQLAFDLADAGNISLQTFYPSLLKIAKEIPFDILVDRITNGPRKILGVNESTIVEGEEAKLTIFDPRMKWRLDEHSNKSKSKNSPYWQKTLEGKVIGTINKQRITIE